MFDISGGLVAGFQDASHFGHGTPSLEVTFATCTAVEQYTGYSAHLWIRCRIS